jgi:hypothetical protein
MALAPGLVRARCRDHREPAATVGASATAPVDDRLLAWPPGGPPGAVASVRAYVPAQSAAASSAPPPACVAGEGALGSELPLGAVSVCRPLRRPLRGLVARTRRTAVLDAVGAR